VKAWYEAALVLGVAGTLYLTGTADIAFYTRGEPREGLVVREMLASGNWLVPARPEGEPARKPPLYYWLAAPALRAVTDHPEFALRLPSAVCATAAVLGVWATARAVFGAAAGLPAALVLATAFEWIRGATSARVDMTLAAALSLVFIAWVFAVERGGRGWPWLAALGMALGTLAKGPVALVLPALAAFVFWAVRRERHVVARLGALRAVAAATFLAGAWYVAAFLRQGPELLDVVARENLLRFVDAEAGATGHAHSTGYLVPLGLVGLLPWTPLLVLAILPLRARPRRPAAVFAAAWSATGVVFFSLAAAKRSVYLLPIYPALALLLGAGIAAPPADDRVTRLARIGAALYPPGLLALAGVACALALGLDPTAPIVHFLHPPDAAGAVMLVRTALEARWLLAGLALVTVTGSVVIARAARRAAWRRLVTTLALLALAWTAVFDAYLHPAIARDRSLKAFMEEVARQVPAEAALYTVFPPDPGLRFYAPRRLERWPQDGAPSGAYLLLWEDDWHRLGAAAGAPQVESEARQPTHGRLGLLIMPAIKTDSRRR
jgi:4-amino-4-deoxy-L-arabinose transferase-like glycosyltransferase